MIVRKSFEHVAEPESLSEEVAQLVKSEMEKLARALRSRLGQLGLNRSCVDFLPVNSSSFALHVEIESDQFTSDFFCE